MSKVFSAPGKALIAGGYLVLDPAYNAYVTALSSRMHARIQKETPAQNSSITVSSPQFGGVWTYTIDNSGPVAEFSEVKNSRNPFVEAVIKTVLNYIGTNDRFALSITLFSDPGYHTQENAVGKTSTNGTRTFLFHSKRIEDVAKTGMGLSAGLVAVVTAALVCHFTGKSVDSARNIIHNVAQIAHCEAQGKIGSGFDVAAAVYGSIIYRRFSPETIDHVLGKPLSEALCAEIRRIVDSEWPFTHSQCSLPRGIRLLMGDVNGGSETPKLVSKVLAWRKRDPSSASVYSELDSANESFMAALTNFGKQKSSGKDALKPIVDALTRIRRGLQKLTAASGADVEPVEQTELLDRCALLPGCLGGVVPGAGGYDAICLLVEESRIDELKRVTESDPGFANVTWLDLAEEEQGLKEEDGADYEGVEV